MPDRAVDWSQAFDAQFLQGRPAPEKRDAAGPLGVTLVSGRGRTLGVLDELALDDRYQDHGRSAQTRSPIGHRRARHERRCRELSYHRVSCSGRDPKRTVGPHARSSEGEVTETKTTSHGANPARARTASLGCSPPPSTQSPANHAREEGHPCLGARAAVEPPARSAASACAAPRWHGAPRPRAGAGRCGGQGASEADVEAWLSSRGVDKEGSSGRPRCDDGRSSKARACTVRSSRSTGCQSARWSCGC